MRRRDFIAGLGGAAVLPRLARTQEPKWPMLGLLCGVPFEGPYAGPVAAIRQGLQDAGFVEGRSLVIAYRTAGGVYERLPELAADLVRRGAAVIVAIAAPKAALSSAAKAAIPIVLATGSDTLEVGVVDSPDRPQAKLATASLATTGPAATRLQLMLDLRPGASSLVGYLDNSRASETFETNVENVTEAARRKGREIAVFDAGTERWMRHSSAWRCGASGPSLSQPMPS